MRIAGGPTPTFTELGVSLEGSEFRTWHLTIVSLHPRDEVAMELRQTVHVA